MIYSSFPVQAISNGQVAQNAPHACMVLVIRPEFEGTGNAALGTGSIVSPRHVLTAAHVVRGNVNGGNNRFQINFFSGTSRRTAESSFAITHENFNATNNAFDVALIFIQGTTTFPAANIIRISTDREQTTQTYTVTGFGFTSNDTIGFASVTPYSASQRVALQCQFENYEVSPNHFCAIDDVASPAGIVCRGDNGAGLFITQQVDGADVNTLVKSHFIRILFVLKLMVNFLRLALRHIFYQDV